MLPMNMMSADKVLEPAGTGGTVHSPKPATINERMKLPILLCAEKLENYM